MNLTFDRRFDLYKEYKKNEEECARCMYDAPYPHCCKKYCGKRLFCDEVNCEAECRNTPAMCEK